MVTYTLRRLLQGAIVLLAVIWFSFTLTYFQPDGALAPAYYECKERLTHACLHYYINQFGLYKPYQVRFWDYLTQLVVHFNLGYSYVQNESVATLLTVYIPRTFWLALVSLVLATLIAVPLGTYQAWKRNSALDYSATVVTFVLVLHPRVRPRLHPPGRLRLPPGLVPRPSHPTTSTRGRSSPIPWASCCPSPR